MGQVLSPPERNKMIVDITEAQNKMAAVQAWADAQRDLDAALGNDAARFNSLKRLVDSEAGGATTALIILHRPDPAVWDVSAQASDAQAYVAGAAELSEIVKRAAPSQWGPLITAIVTGALSLLPGILAPGPAAPPAPRPVTTTPTNTQPPSEDWPWWAYGLAGLGGLIIVGGAVSLLSRKPAPAPAAVVTAAPRGGK